MVSTRMVTVIQIARRGRGCGNASGSSDISCFHCHENGELATVENERGDAEWSRCTAGGCFLPVISYAAAEMSCTKIDPALHQARKPDWIKVRLPNNPAFFSTKALISDLKLHTVCESAQCPNRWECWSQGTATFMIAGDRCTRACGFCAVTTAKPFALEEDEPARVAEAVRRMKLKHVVITAVARDDLKDGGANHFARVITAIREMDPSIIVEVLVPDFHAQDWCIQIVLDAGPDIYNHNMETVER